MRQVLTGALALAAVMAAGLVALLGLAYFRQESLIFFPDRHVRFTPADLGMAFEDVRLETSDGVTVAAWWVPAPQGRGALIFSHGNAGNMGDRVGKLRLFHDLGLSVLAFDYHGSGASQGKPSEEGTAHDMDAAVAHVRDSRGVPLDRTVFYGESLGGAVVIEAATRLPPAALVAESTFTSARAMARRHYPFVPQALVRVGYDSLSRVRRLACPTLFLHGPADTIVPFEMGEALFRAAPEPKRFATLVGDHNSGGILESPEACRKLAELLDLVLGAGPPRNAQE
ncbi:MAG: alpha/beta hydrolase [Thermoanaerobaculaceae bacterium]|nr:alpha/beta hydrolase [Thermoanaerobaculaceae bacterium]